MKIAHKESSVKVFFTKDYSLFSAITGNRKIDTIKVRRIKADIKDGVDVLKYCPIVVYEKEGVLYIVDGQHRLSAAMQLGSNVWYIIAPELSLEEIARINSNSQTWKNTDFIESHVLRDSDDYKKLQQFRKKRKIPLGCAIRLLSTGSVGNDTGLRALEQVAFKYGKLKATHYEQACVFADHLEKFKEFPWYNSRRFMIALEKMMDSGADIDQLAAGFKNAPQVQKTSVAEYISLLNQFYIS
jgi:hypothetical protein